MDVFLDKTQNKTFHNNNIKKTFLLYIQYLDIRKSKSWLLISKEMKLNLELEHLGFVTYSKDLSQVF